MRLKKRSSSQSLTASAQAGVLAYYQDGNGVTAIKSTSDGFSGGGWLLPGAKQADYRDTEDSYARAYIACVWAKTGVDVVASKISEVLHRGQVKDKAGKLVSDNALKKALDTAYIKWLQDVYGQWTLHKWLFGEAYIELVSAKVPHTLYTIPIGLRALNPLAIEPIYPHDEIIHYDYTTPGGSPVRLQPNQVIFDRFPNPEDDLRGLSKLSAALESLNIDRQVILTTKGYLKNNMRPGIIFTPRGDLRLTKNDKDLMRQTIGEQGKGANNAARPLFIDFPMDVTTVAAPAFEDQSYLNENDMERICAAIRVPVALVNYNNQKFQLGAEQRKGFYTETVIPEAKKIARLISAVALPFLCPNQGYTFDIDEAGELDKLDDPAAKTDRVSKQFASGGLTFNQMVTAYGNDPVPGGDWYALPAGIIPITAAQMPQVAQIASGGQGAPPSAPMPGNAPQAPQTAPAPASGGAHALPTAGKDATKSAAIMLGLGAHPDLVGLQNTARQYCARSGVQVEWNDPAEFHVTLLYAPAITEADLAALRRYVAGLEIPPLDLRIGSLGTFDSLDSYAIRFMLRRNPDLLDVQQELVDYCAANDIPISQYSDPAQYKPHITMGYASSKPKGLTFNSRLNVQPQRLQLGVDDAIVYERPLTYTAKTAPPSEYPFSTYVPGEIRGEHWAEAVGAVDGLVFGDVKKGTWDEGKHPRADNGQFGSGGGGHSSHDKPADSGRDNAPLDTSHPDHFANWDTGYSYRAPSRTADGYRDYGSVQLNDGMPGSQAAIDEFKKNAQPKLNYLTSLQKESTVRYTGDEYRVVNDALRKDAKLPEDKRKMVLGLDNAMKVTKLDEPTIVYRGMYDHSGKLPTLKPGMTFEDKAFGSSSISTRVARQFAGSGEGSVMMRIKVPKGHPGIPVEPVSSHPGELEIILPRGTTYKITSVEKDHKSGRTYVTAEVVHQERFDKRRKPKGSS